MTLRVQLKKSLGFFEIFRIPVNAASNFILRWTLSQTISRLFFPKVQVGTYRIALDILQYLRYYARVV